MKTKEITENNKLIAEFMGMKPSKIFGKYSISKDHCTCNEDTPDKAMNGFASIAKYNTSWDWLMPVVKKVREVHNVELSVDQYTDTQSIINRISPYDYDINQVYKAIVEFITWYNENK